MIRENLIAGTIILFLAASSRAGYYSDSGKGWWWYEKPEKIEDEKTGDKPKQAMSFKDVTYDQMWNMHPDQFKDFADTVKKKAVQTPTEENVKEYYQVQEIARKKALAFTNVAQYVLQKYPELTTRSGFPPCFLSEKSIFHPSTIPTFSMPKVNLGWLGGVRWPWAESARRLIRCT